MDKDISLEEYTAIMEEIEHQPPWRSVADKEMEYADGNQLDSELLRKQRELGIPPAVEDVISPALLSIQGYEEATRTDWRVTPDGDIGGQDVADALSYKLNQAERMSKADRACSEAFRSQLGVGVGWVEVGRESDPFKFPYRCKGIHRNEIHWDMNAQEDDLSDARWLRRQRWLEPERISAVFPEDKELLESLGRHGSEWWAQEMVENADGGSSTGLNNSWAETRGWTIAEDRWYNPTSRKVCLAELWYRRWVSVIVLKSPDGRVVEYDENSIAHAVAIASGTVGYTRAIVAKVRRSFWVGPHCLYDGPTPHTHQHFPYAPFFGFREDATQAPYGYIRGMIYPQDSLNSGISKLRWGMAVVRTERTKGAVAMTDAQFRKQISRVDADIVLDADHMARPGATFKVNRDFELNQQQFQLLQDNRNSIERVSAVTSGFMGKQGNARSGVQEATQVEQSNQALGRLMDNFRVGRTLVGEMLLAMIVQDMGDKEQTIVIEGDAVRADRTVVLNHPERDPAGYPYLSNDLQRTRLKVALEDVPSSSSYRAQQLNAMSEAVKSLPEQYQPAVMPFLVSLMDVPFKRDVVEAIREAGQQQSPEEIEQRIQQEVEQALANSKAELKMRELDIKEGKPTAEIEKIRAEAVRIGVQAAYSAMQSGAQIAQMPQIAPIADAVMAQAGYQRPAAPMVEPGYTDPGNFGPVPDVQANPNPEYPPVPTQPDSAMSGIETQRTEDNLPL